MARSKRPLLITRQEGAAYRVVCHSQARLAATEAATAAAPAANKAKAAADAALAVDAATAADATAAADVLELARQSVFSCSVASVASPSSAATKNPGKNLYILMLI